MSKSARYIAGKQLMLVITPPRNNHPDVFICETEGRLTTSLRTPSKAWLAWWRACATCVHKDCVNTQMLACAFYPVGAPTSLRAFHPL